MCQRDCRDSDGKRHSQRTLRRGHPGQDRGDAFEDRLLEREFGAGEFFHLADERSSPTPLFLPPPFLRSKQDEQARFVEQTGIAIAPGSTGVNSRRYDDKRLDRTLTSGLSALSGASGSIGGIVSPS